MVSSCLVWQEILSSSHLFAIYTPFVDLKVHEGLYFGLFDSSRAGMGLHVRKGVKDKIFILNLNHTSLSF